MGNSKGPAGFDVHADWWNTNVGASGQHLNTEFWDEFFEPACKKCNQSSRILNVYKSPICHEIKGYL